MTKRCALWDYVVTILLLLGAVCLNWMGMGHPAMTIGRLLGLLGYLILSAILVIWVINCFGRAIEARKRKGIFSVGAGLLALFLLFVWPYTEWHGRLDDFINRQGREKVICQWREGELPLVGSQSHWVGFNSWDRRMYVVDDMFIFGVYNGFCREQEVLYSSQEPTGRWSGAIPLGDGWYRWTGYY